MKDNLILLADLLANDDNFAADFSSRKSVNDKFKLAKAKLKNLEKEEFTEFLERLQSLEKIGQRLSMEELENVSGGVGGYKTKLAALAFLGLALTPLASMGTEIASADYPPFYENFYNADEKKIINEVDEILKEINKLNEKSRSFSTNVNTLSEKYKSIANVKNDSFVTYLKDLSLRKSNVKLSDAVKKFKGTSLYSCYIKSNKKMQPYRNIYNNVIKKTIENDNFFKENKTKLSPFDERLVLKTNHGDYSISKSDYNHIIYGDYHNTYAAHKSGGHTINAQQLMKDIYSEKMKINDNPFIEQVINNEENLPEGYEGTATEDMQRKITLANGLDAYHLPDSNRAFPDVNKNKSSYEYHNQSFFPKNWGEKAVINAMKKCIEIGLKIEDNDQLRIKYCAVINGIPMTVVVRSDNSVESTYPLIKATKRGNEFFIVEKIGKKLVEKKLSSVNTDLSADPFESLADLQNNNELPILSENPNNVNNNNDNHWRIVSIEEQHEIENNDINNSLKGSKSGVKQQRAQWNTHNKFGVLSSDTDEDAFLPEEDNDVNSEHNSTDESEYGWNSLSNYSEGEHSYETDSESDDEIDPKYANDSTKLQPEKEQSSTGFSFKNLISKLWPF